MSIANKDESSKKELPPTKKDTCFTIMPFGGWFNEYYENIYKPAIKSAGLTPCRADDLYFPGTIVNDIWKFTKNAKIVLADLTGKNPNVFYELGLAHAVAKPAILITETMNDVPFDLRALRVIEYDKNVPNWGDLLQEKIITSIKQTLESPNEAVLPTFLTISKSKKEAPITSQEAEIIRIKQELASLRRLVSSGESRSIPSSHVARQIIRNHLRSGDSPETILEMLLSRGVPEDWATNSVLKEVELFNEKPPS